ncbi:MAG: PxKF domain-containing protein [Actinomycetota bacterium]|nr:PxKF domain-containing protein [Actinomycetota bacterium]
MRNTPQFSMATASTAMASPARAALRVLVLLSVVLASFGGALPAHAASAASFSGGSGTVTVGSTLYAKKDGALTLTVTTNNAARCVEVTGDHSGRQTSNSTKTTWNFQFNASAGDGVRTVNVASTANSNQNGCTGQSQGSTTASYVLDNTGPVVTGVVSPAPNSAGWNKDNLTVTWSATDAGSGVGNGPTPASTSVNTPTSGQTLSSDATDKLGNAGTGSVVIKLDKGAPTITGSRSPTANAHGWNNADVTVSFSCSDDRSGVKSCSGPTTLTSNGANQSVTGHATDNADNASSATVGSVSIDKVAPTLSGAPTTPPNGANGWYRSDVTIAWTAADALSGILDAPASSTITGEGEGLTASASVSDRAGNATSATSPAVKIDKTAPLTTAVAPTNWNNVDQTVSLSASDAGSGVASTHYRLNGGDAQTGYGVTLSAEGVHTLEYWSVDKAGNVEAPKTVEVKIDRTPPRITHFQSPARNGHGWNNSDVTVTFECSDEQSGIASCTAPQTVTGQGANQAVHGTAVDNAGNSVTDPALVSIDKTPPTISAAADRGPNSHGWYAADVFVSFSCADALSGIDACPGRATVGEGANQSVSGTANDAAGNTANASLSLLNVDKTPPSINGAATTGPNANGWYSGDVTVAWTCSDTLSGLAGPCPPNATIAGEGNSLSASASVSDKAGHSASASVSGVKIDRTAPSTSASVPPALESGWYAGEVTVTLTGVDHLSGVATTYYTVNGGAAQTYSGPFNVTAKGVNTVTFWSVDKAGNVEDVTASGHSLTVKIDGVPPTITGSRMPPANVHGWNNSPATVSFHCSDAESGIASCTDPITLANAGAGQSTSGVAQDNAGNTSSTTVDNINIDLTAPNVTGLPTTPANGAGWYKDDVAIAWTGQDGLSGIDPDTIPPNSVITGEGADLGAGPVTMSDKAGNVGYGSVSGIKIDRTPPVISGAPTTSPNTAGWYRSAVTVAFSCTDNLSGCAGGVDSRVLASDGASQSVTSDPAADLAGNVAAGRTVGGISIDSLAPVSQADIDCNGRNGWCRGNSATVIVTAADQAGLSGVREIRYQVNGGTWTTVTGPTATVSVPLHPRSGTATVQFHAVDVAGNQETLNGVSLKYDNIAPTVSHSLDPASNAAGWNKANTTVTFTAVDDSDGSGVDAATLTAPVTVSTETAGQVVNGEAHDMAGNKGTDSVNVKLDKTAPTISGAATTSPNASGWYTGPVTVKFTCSDTLSGVAVCPADETVSTNGTNQSVSGTAIDKAGNDASVTVGGLNIDAVKPVITDLSVVSGAMYTLGAVPAATCAATDADSGPDGCSVVVIGGTANGVGTFTYTATARDNAGNVTTQTGTYRVIYRWVGFSQPITDTAHQQGAVSTFKAQGTVPAKFQLTMADGTIVQANTLPTWLTPVKGSPTTAAVNEDIYTEPATSGGSYRWSTDDRQYIYNWGTAKNQAGNHWRIGVTLDDGQTYYVIIGLR